MAETKRRQVVEAGAYNGRPAGFLVSADHQFVLFRTSWPCLLDIHQRSGLASPPVRELKGFRHITLEAGDSRTVPFTLGPAELRYWSAALRDWTIDASTFDVWVGGDSTAQLTTTFEVTKA